MKQEYPRLKRSPLVEVVLDVRVENHDPINLELLSQLPVNLKQQFGLVDRHEMLQYAFNLKLTKEVHSPSESMTLGYAYHSKEQKVMLRMEQAGFSMHLVNGYSDWVHFSSMARSLWDFYDQATGAKGVSRLGLRYVNRFEFPSPLMLGDYLNFYLVGPDNLQASWGSNMNMQLSILNDDALIAGFVQIAYLPSAEKEDAFDVLFDIDVSRTEALQAAELWETFDSLRSFKNEIFFKGITERTLGLIDT